MKIKDGFVVRDIMGQCVVVATGEASESFSGMIKLNDTGKDIWEGVAAGKSEEEIIDQIVEDYDVDKERAKDSVSKFIADMKDKGFIID
ncbi:MAG: PqqD family protein [Eubacterium sp.]|nr:PqqD family protein [Eubacterium sp.]